MIFALGAIVTAPSIPIMLWPVPGIAAFLVDRQPRGALAKVNRTMTRLGYSPLFELLRREANTKPVSLAEVFAPGMAGVTVLFTITYFAPIMTFYFLMRWTSKIVADMGFPASATGGVLVWTNVGGATGAVALNLLTQRFGFRPLVIAAMLGGVVAISRLGKTPHTLAAVALLGGFFINGATAGLYAVFAQSFLPRPRAGGTGLVIGLGRGGAALGPVLAGLLFSAGWPLAWVGSAMATGSLVGAALYFLRYREVEAA